MQAPAPNRPIDRGLAGAGLLAHVLVSKYADHLPLYRQAEIYQREGVELDRSTLADWVGGASRTLQPLVEALKRYVLGAEKLHGDDVPVPVLEPGRGKTKTGRLWTYVRDDRPADSADPAAVWFAYSPDRKGEHPAGHLQNYVGVLQADGYAGFNKLYETGRIVEAACWAHVRRKFHDLFQAHRSPIAKEALERIGALYGIEQEIRGRAPAERSEVRQTRSRPLLESMQVWLKATLAKLSQKSDVAVAICYALDRWAALLRFSEDGRVEMDNNAAGGMGVVYRAYDAWVRRPVTLKVLSVDQLTGAGSSGQLQRVARAASAFNHPNIVTVHEVGLGTRPAIYRHGVCGGPFAGPGDSCQWVPVARVLDYAAEI